MLALATQAGASIASVKSGGIGGPPFSVDAAGFIHERFERVRSIAKGFA